MCAAYKRSPSRPTHLLSYSHLVEEYRALITPSLCNFINSALLECIRCSILTLGFSILYMKSIWLGHTPWTDCPLGLMVICSSMENVRTMSKTRIYHCTLNNAMKLTRLKSSYLHLQHLADTLFWCKEILGSVKYSPSCSFIRITIKLKPS